MPLHEGVILTICKLDDEGNGVARFCLLDSSKTPFVDPYTRKTTWTRAALNHMLKNVSWREGKTKIKFDEQGYNVYAEPSSN